MWTDVKDTGWFQVLILESWAAASFLSLFIFSYAGSSLLTGFSLVLVTEGYSPVVVHGLSWLLIAEHGL